MLNLAANCLQKEDIYELKSRLHAFKVENDKFADVKAQLEKQIAEVQVRSCLTYILFKPCIAINKRQSGQALPVALRVHP